MVISTTPKFGKCPLPVFSTNLVNWDREALVHVFSRQFQSAAIEIQESTVTYRNHPIIAIPIAANSELF